jgi:hypothetical protein
MVQLGISINEMNTSLMIIPLRKTEKMLKFISGCQQSDLDSSRLKREGSTGGCYTSFFQERQLEEFTAGMSLSSLSIRIAKDMKFYLSEPDASIAMPSEPTRGEALCGNC